MALLVSTGSQAVAKAAQWIGTPYCWGGGHSGPVPVGTCVDCSGLVNQVYGTTGNTYSQVQMGQAVSSIKQAGPGDLVFFGPLAPGEPHHVGIYVGANQMIDAPHTGTQVRRDSVNGFGPINAIRRLVPTGAGDASGSGGVVYDYAQLEAVWIQAGGNAQAAPMAAAIAMAESGGSAAASNSNGNNTIDRGLWQINSSHGVQSSFDVMTNARAAVAISNNGQSWRPWCTAYSDGACGSRGGVYQGPGSPYLKFYNPNVQPDFSVPINATNAAANQSGETQAIEVSSVWDAMKCAANPALCVSAGISGVPLPTNPLTNLSASIINGVIKSILNPIIQPIAGGVGLLAGGVLMISGVYILVSGSRAGQGLRSAVGAGFRVAAPELGIGMSAGERTAFRTQQTAGMRITGRQQLSAQQAGQRAAAAEIGHQRRLEAMSTEQLLNLQSMAFKEYLMRTRPPRSGKRPPEMPGPRPHGPGRRPPGITARSSG